MSGRFLMVIPPVVISNGGVLEVDVDFANNLRAYLENFEHVTIACPSCHPDHRGGIPSTVKLAEVAGHDRVTFAELPWPYREDRYLRWRGPVLRKLTDLIDEADYLSFSPHGPLDWATLAAQVALKLNRSYDIGADWDVKNVAGAQIARMRFGPERARRSLLLRRYLRSYQEVLKGSSVALLMGQDVYDAYKNIAPNAQKVFNIQVTSDDRITPEELAAKLDRIETAQPLSIAYAGRVHEMKGPLDWLNALNRLVQQDVALKATWFGTGELFDQVQDRKARFGLTDDIVAFPGKVDRAFAMRTIRQADIFLFCHKTPESPRNLIEALASGAPLVGYESRYARDLVSSHGGGEFVSVGDWEGLAELVRELSRDRARLSQLVRAAYATAQTLDREEAILHRIALIKTYVKPPRR